MCIRDRRVRDLQAGTERWLRVPLQRNALESNATRDVLPDYAFTPDGRAVVVSYDGKIHRIDVASGTDTIIPFSANVSMQVASPLMFPRRLPQEPVTARYVQHAAVASDGRVAYSGLARLFVTGQGGTPARLTATDRPAEFMPAWSPDGQWIAFVTWSSDGGALWKVPGGGGTPTRLSEGSAFWLDPAWTPDGTSIVALRAPEGSARRAPGIPQDAELVRVPATGGPATMMSAAPGMRHPHFTTDVARVFVSAPDGLVSMKLDGSDKRIVAKPARSGPNVDVRISPDGTRMAVIAGEQVSRFNLPGAGGADLVELRHQAHGTAPGQCGGQLETVGGDHERGIDAARVHRRGIHVCHDAVPPERQVPGKLEGCLLYTSPSPRDRTRSRMPSSA